jgi:ATP-dependent DNA helicase UvrD/PcrA
MHAAKGLEFPVVFIVGLEDGLMPLTFGVPDPATLAEERRLLYVGMTRAKDRLLLSRAERRTLRGRVREQEPSRFLADIERELLRQQASDLPRRKPQAQQLSLF